MEGGTSMMSPDNFPYDLDELGEVVAAEQECPGVYYVAVNQGGSFAAEFYIVERGTEAISDKAKAYGKPLDLRPDLLSIPLDDPAAGGKVIAYEIKKYRLANDLPDTDGETLLTLEVYGRENNPEYFGPYAAPTDTPMGKTTQSTELANGVFYLKTDSGKAAVAVCYPLWEAAFTEYTKQLGRQTAYDCQHGIDNTLGYLFFGMKDACLALFEILSDRPELIERGVIDPAALNNAIWRQHPEYAVIYNRTEQTGLHDALGLLLNAAGVDEDLTISPERMIALIEGAGTDYILVGHKKTQTRQSWRV